jgi:hypothetical protein
MYQKYYSFIDKQNTYYIAVLLDPRVKCKLIQQEIDADGYNALLAQLRLIFVCCLHAAQFRWFPFGLLLFVYRVVCMILI